MMLPPTKSKPSTCKKTLTNSLSSRRRPFRTLDACSNTSFKWPNYPTMKFAGVTTLLFLVWATSSICSTKGRRGRYTSVHTSTRSTTPRTCATTAIIAKAKQRWPQLVSTPTSLTTPTVSVRTATSPSITFVGRRSRRRKTPQTRAARRMTPSTFLAHPKSKINNRKVQFLATVQKTILKAIRRDKKRNDLIKQTYVKTLK